MFSDWLKVMLMLLAVLGAMICMAHVAACKCANCGCCCCPAK